MKSITDEKLNNIINSNHLRSLSIYLEFNKKQLLELIKRKVSLKEIYNFYVNETSNNINFNSFKSRFYQFKKSFNKDDLKYLNEFTPKAVEPTSTEPKLEISSEVRAVEPISTEPKLETSSSDRAVEHTSTEPKLEIRSSEIETIKNLIYNTYQNKIKNLDKFYIDLNFIKELVKEIKLNIKFPTISKNYDLDLIDTYDKIELQNILNSIEYFYNYITSDLMWSFFYTSRFINYINENDFKFKSRVKQYLNKTN